MTSKASSPDEYVEQLPADRKEAISKLRSTISQNIDDDCEERMSYGMIGYVVPHSVYPGGYHCDPKQPLPFICVASQKNYISLYHMGLYGESKLLQWFEKEWPKYSDKKLDMGKGCVRFKKPESIPYKLIGELVHRMSSKDWIKIYETNLKR